jgi:hypothetical protein
VTTTKSLAGKTILITRPREQSAVLVRALERRGATAIVAPAVSSCVAVACAAEALWARRRRVRWSLTSPRTVDMLVANVEPREVGRDRRDRREHVERSGWAQRDPTWSEDLHDARTGPGPAARRRPRPVSTRGHRSRGTRGRARAEGMAARARRGLPHAPGALAPEGRPRRAPPGRCGRGHLHERIDRPWVRRRARRGEGPPEGGLHRADHRPRGA